MPEVILSNVSKSYGEIIALYKVNLRIRDGEYFCIIGPSGSGKSTLLKIIAGIVRQDEGDVYIDGRLVNDVPIEERNIGLVFQEIYLFPHMTVWDNITYSPMIKGEEVSVVENIGRELTTTLSLGFRKSNYPDELSLGMQQKVALARALASGSKLLLLDEPLGSLDPRSAFELRFELRKLIKDLHLTAIHVTHNQEEAMMIADRIAIMRKGRIVQVGTPKELYYNPVNPFVAKFIGGENNFITGYIKKKRDNMAIIDVNGLTIRCKTHLEEGKKVVLAIRPEFIDLSKDKKEKGLLAKIKERRYMGKYIRYLVELNNELRLIVKTQITKLFEKEDEVYVNLNENRIIIFEYPKEGLERAISYE